jgi:hypothetical protein
VVRVSFLPSLPLALANTLNSCSRGRNKVNPQPILGVLELMGTDTLILLDTRFGARITKRSYDGIFIKEMLSATGSHDHDEAPTGVGSFTRCIVEGLESGLENPTAVGLHQYLHSLGRYTVDPYHAWFSGKSKWGSISLEPLKPTEKAPSQPKDRSELVGSSQRPPPPDRKSQVLLKVVIEDDVGPDDVAEWKYWLSTNVPRAVEHVSVELVAPSNDGTGMV